MMTIEGQFDWEKRGYITRNREHCQLNFRKTYKVFIDGDEIKQMTNETHKKKVRKWKSDTQEFKFQEENICCVST